MKIIKRYFDSKVILFKMNVFNDSRGYSHETFNKETLKNNLPEFNYPLEGELNLKKTR